jgi:hypothetical protein
MKLMRVFGLVAVALVAGACGAAPSQQMPAAPSGGPYGNAKSAEAAGQYPGAPTPSQEYPAATAGAPQSADRAWAKPPPPLAGPSAEGEESKRGRALVDDFNTAELAVMGAGNDCTSACRALRSMQRAAARLCSIAANDDERERCKSAQDRVRAARERVRNSCGQCSGGPSLDPNAPIDEP